MIMTLTDAYDAAVAHALTLDLTDFAALEPVIQGLIDEPLTGVEELRQWLGAVSGLDAVLSEHAARLAIEHSQHTDHEAAERAYLFWIERMQPRISPLFFQLQRKLVGSPRVDQLVERKFAMLLRDYRADVAIYRDENVPLFVEVSQRTTQYGKLTGAMAVELDGQTLTLPQASRLLERTDRAVRERAWRAMSERRLRDRGAIDGLFDELMSLRQRIAANAGHADFRSYTWASMKRFDYTPQDCRAFNAAIERSVVPLVRRLDERRRSNLRVDTLRPWDLGVDEHGRAPLEPFDAKRIDTLVSGTQRVFERLDPRLAERFARLKPGTNLDLESRAHKRPGGFQSSLHRVREPFIFMNAAGSQRDVQTLLHEAGHAFHFQCAADEPLVDLRSPGLEFCEVASMSMELLASDAMDVFYPDPAQAQRAKLDLLEGIVRFFPWMATIDHFQHWLYEHPGHTAGQRTAAWREVLTRYSSGVVDFAGLEEARDAMWQRQLHLIHYPFYYVEYGIAQLGALQVWMNYQRDPSGTLQRLLDAFALGRKVPLPELFEAAGIRFDFSEATLAPLMERLMGMV